ncbi:hypothetical protein [Plantibacter flavus]|nr:hypothetical protein [Plantibacter flavus]
MATGFHKLVQACAGVFTLANIRTIISISLDIGRLIDRGNVFVASPSFGQ